MIGSRTQSLRVRPGEPLTAEKWNGLLDQIDQATRATPGAGMLVHSLPSGRIFTARAGRGSGGGGMGNHPFKVTISAGDNNAQLRAAFNLGLIAGVEPRIGPDARAVTISDPSDPTFIVDCTKAVDATTGRGGLYWRCVLNPDFSVQRVYPMVSAKPPATQDYTAFKLIGFLIRDVADATALPAFRQMLFHNLNHAASQRHGGKALHRFSAV